VALWALGNFLVNRKIKLSIFFFLNSKYSSCYEGSEIENILSEILNTCSTFFLNNSTYIVKEKLMDIEEKKEIHY